MKNILPLLIILIFSTHPSLKAQTPEKAGILKIGFTGDPFVSNETKMSGFQIGLENSMNAQFITNQVSAGYLNNINDLYYLKFDYRFYPVSALLKNYKYQGLYFGLGPGMYVQETKPGENEFGLAFFATTGVQLFVNNRFSVALEFELNTISPGKTMMPPIKHPVPESFRDRKRQSQSISENSFYFTGSLKIGYLFNHSNGKKVSRFTE